MDKLKLFLLADGAIIAAGLLFFLFHFLRRQSSNSNFRDDIWAEKKKQAAEDLVDKKILLGHRPDPNEKPEPEEKARPEPSAKPEFQAPNFRGRPHEILGIPAHASRETVMKAYKYWIKRYHPDRVTHLGETYVNQARRRAEQLNSARDELLRVREKR